MFNKSSGSMYEEIEASRLKKVHKTKIIIRRIVAITILALIIVYLGILLNDIRRYHNGLLPLILISTTEKTYDDGKVTTYSSIGWVFRTYERETITDSEIAPFWASIKMDNILKRNNDPNLPEVETNYVVPVNLENYEKVDNVLFFYDSDKNLLGTYACLLSNKDCEVSYSYNFNDDDVSDETKMGIIDSRYVFITEYKNKDTEAEEKHVYLYDITAKRFVGEYQNVHYSIINNDLGYIDSSKYIVEKNNLWGIDQVIKGQVTNYVDYIYNYISYDADTKLYIIKNTDNKWLAYNAENKTTTGTIDNKIRKIYLKNNKIYFLTYDVSYNKSYNYKLYSSDGLNVLVKDEIDNLEAYDKYLTYTKDDILHIIDYDGTQVVPDVKLYFSGTSFYQIKSFYLKEEGNTLIISTPQEAKYTHLTDEYYYDMTSWALLKTRLNVSETVS